MSYKILDLILILLGTGPTLEYRINMETYGVFLLGIFLAISKPSNYFDLLENQFKH